MPLLARAPCLASRSARSHILFQSRGVHDEYKIRISSWDLRFHGGAMIKVECSTSHSTTTRRFRLLPQQRIFYPVRCLLFQLSVIPRVLLHVHATVEPNPTPRSKNYTSVFLLGYTQIDTFPLLTRLGPPGGLLWRG